ncbi:Bax inhibitor-1/YccA family protein [Elizabethkingia anophelis]|nr:MULTISPECIES: Bax inhibitor-1/YccA family protein [Elizabethkingia]MCL1640850.1 Bax inhibitor-1/YccA family protein [Elizabethkingia anophelis]MCL1646651.1 Bax inhibitor-1/YccA family protein [Elizabethkingia anophelis]MCL1688716.1 Bax inhibitor-1/YccA family protein [Elizabethkingia anophelis]MDX8560286.1 Bax inhibitor-1/YccA family protein [Elizabethkingia sp. HX ZCH]MDX8578895.1 Bax inhibitor-1/YccA family protein [Elizabethkingia sp. HX YK]
MSKVYGWMSLALVVTGLIAYLVAGSETLITAIMANKLLFYGLIIAEFGLVIWLSTRIAKMSTTTAIAAFMGYAVLNGLTLSLIFLIYTFSSIALTFFVTAGTFAVMSIYGYVTKTDLTKIGKIMMMLLVGIIIASLVNLFLKSPMIYWITTYVGVAVFVGLIAYDTQKIKNYFLELNGDESLMGRMAIMGALTLYLDFINLFLFLLRLFGGGRSND